MIEYDVKPHPDDPKGHVILSYYCDRCKQHGTRELVSTNAEAIVKSWYPCFSCGRAQQWAPKCSRRRTGRTKKRAKHLDDEMDEGQEEASLFLRMQPLPA